MNYSPVYLYPNLITAYSNALDSWQGGFRKVYQRNLKLYRGVDNSVDIQVRNGDQKALDITGSTVVFSVVARDTQELVLNKDGSYPDDSSISKGKVRISLTSAELMDLEPGFYNYSISTEVRNTISIDEYTVTSRSPLYVDSQFGVLGTLEVSGEVDGMPSKEIEYTFSRFVDYENLESSYTSAIIDTNWALVTPASRHTLQFYATNFIGDIFIEGSVETGASPNTWSTITTLSSADSTTLFDTVFYKELEGKYSFLRIRYIPIQGTVDKVLYR